MKNHFNDILFEKDIEDKLLAKLRLMGHNVRRQVYINSGVIDIVDETEKEIIEIKRKLSESSMRKGSNQLKSYSEEYSEDWHLVLIGPKTKSTNSFISVMNEKGIEVRIWDHEREEIESQELIRSILKNDREKVEAYLFTEETVNLSNEIKKGILVRLAKYGNGTSFVELVQHFPKIQGDYSITCGDNESIIIWIGLSKEFIDWFYKMGKKGIITINVHNILGNVMSYFFDGGGLSLKPLEKLTHRSLNHHYKEPRWVPILLGTVYRPTEEEFKNYRKKHCYA